MSRRITPDLESVIFTGLFVPMNRNAPDFAEYVDLNFSLTTMFSCETRLFSLVLSSMRLRSPSCWIATSGFSRKLSRANWLFDPVRAFESNVAEYPSNSFSTTLRTVDLPEPASP